MNYFMIKLEVGLAACYNQPELEKPFWNFEIFLFQQSVSQAGRLTLVKSPRARPCFAYCCSTQLLRCLNCMLTLAITIVYIVTLVRHRSESHAKQVLAASVLPCRANLTGVLAQQILLQTFLLG